jgi:hypothetical protein
MSVKARDLRVNIAEMGFGRGVVHTLELALEDLSALRGNLRDAAETMQLMVNELEKFMKVATTMGQRIDEIRRRQQQDEPDGKPGS